MEESGHSPYQAVPVESPLFPVYRTIVAVDIAPFEARPRPDPVLAALRSAVYDMVADAFNKVRLSWSSCLSEDRREGVLVVAPPDVPRHYFVADIPKELAAALDEHNLARDEHHRLRLRAVVHAGEVCFDGEGIFGAPVTEAFQLLDSYAPRKELARSSSSLALVTTHQFFAQDSRPDPADDPAQHQPIETSRPADSQAAWVRFFAPHGSYGAPVPLTGPPGGHRPPGPLYGDENAHVAADRDTETGAPPHIGDFDEFYLANFRLVRNILHARAQDWALAEEVTNDAMAIAYRRWDELSRNHPNVVGFVVVTARRILSSIQRRRARKFPAIPPLSLEANPGLELRASGADPADTAVDRTAIERALRTLPADHRECFVLYEILDRPVGEIAELLGLPEGTVKTRLRAARLALRDVLNNDPSDGGAP